MDNNQQTIRGRSASIEKRMPFTTAISLKNKCILELLSSTRNQRKADILNSILNEYFEQHLEVKEQALVDIYFAQRQ